MNINRLLLIQDNTLVQNFYRDRLERAGFIVQSVSTVEEGLRRMGSALPDVVVLDPLLPEGDAAQSIASVRSLMGASEVPVVVLPTQQRCITEAIEQNKRTRLIEPGGNVAATLITEAAGLAHVKMADLAEMTANSEPDERWRTAALNAAPAAVAAHAADAPLPRARTAIARVPADSPAKRPLFRRPDVASRPERPFASRLGP